MSKKTAGADALVISGDERIQNLLAGGGAVVWPAYACRLDGFANDTFTEYADASVYRPGSVCQARLVSAIRDVIYTSGRYYLGFTMYTSAGYDETIDVWIGHRRVACARIADPDNRVHLFVAPEAFRFRGGEPVRLETGETDGPCRIENLVLLPKRPRAVEPRLEIISPHVDLRYDSGDIHAYVTWVTNRPASGRLEWRRGRASPKTMRITRPSVNHEVVM